MKRFQGIAFGLDGHRGLLASRILAPAAGPAQFVNIQIPGGEANRPRGCVSRLSCEIAERRKPAALPAARI
jgi:hypothetical protein